MRPRASLGMDAPLLGLSHVEATMRNRRRVRNLESVATASSFADLDAAFSERRENRRYRADSAILVGESIRKEAEIAAKIAYAQKKYADKIAGSRSFGNAITGIIGIVAAPFTGGASLVLTANAALSEAGS